MLMMMSLDGIVVSFYYVTLCLKGDATYESIIFGNFGLWLFYRSFFFILTEEDLVKL